MLLLTLLVQITCGAKLELPSQIETAFRKSGQPSPEDPTIPWRESQSFVDYVTKNWRTIALNIECLPPEDGLETEKGVKFNVSVIHFGYACANLPPMEYVEFFEQITTLYEQKRISFTAFENIYYGADAKDYFWSVNWEHPRVQKIFDRIRKFNPPPNQDFLSMVDDQAHGKLADNYRVNSSDDDPLPQTLPGIKLQRPFASVIRKYEAMTGKRVPPDPDFPDHHVNRPSRKGLREVENDGSASDAASLSATSWWKSWGMVASLLGGLLFVFFWFRSWMRPV